MDGEDDDIDGDETTDEDEEEGSWGGGDGGDEAVVVVALSWLKLLAAAAATLWMDLGDIMVFSWGTNCEEALTGKLRLAEEPLRHKRAASYALAAASAVE